MKRMWLHASLHSNTNNTNNTNNINKTNNTNNTINNPNKSNNTHNANVKQLLHPLLDAVSPHTVNYSQQNVPVLDMWLHQTTAERNT